MVGEKDYNDLLTSARRFCYGTGISEKVDYRDIVHDILLSGELGNKTNYTLFRTFSRYYKNYRVIRMADTQHYEDGLKKIEYKYCYHCDQVLPLEHFISGEERRNISNYCREYRNAARQVKRAVEIKELAPSYLKKLTHNSKTGKTEEEVKNKIIKRRSETKEDRIILRREAQREAQKKCRANSRKNLADCYIIDILKRSKTPGENITPEMIIEKREYILQKRANNKVW